MLILNQCQLLFGTMEGITKETHLDQVNFDVNAKSGENQSSDSVETADLNNENNYNTTSSDYTDPSQSSGTYSEDIKTDISPSFSNTDHDNSFQLKKENTCDSSSIIAGDVLALFPFVCGICNEKFNSLPSYFMHISVHENVSIFLHSCNMFKGCDDIRSSFYSCGICDIKYPTLCTLYEHLLEVEGISDFVYKSQDRTARPLIETYIDLDVNYLKTVKNENCLGQSKETLQHGKASDTCSGNESDTTEIDENTNETITESENRKIKATGRHLSKTNSNRNLKRESQERHTNKVGEHEEKKSVKLKSKGSNVQARKTEKKPSKVVHKNITRNVCKTDNNVYKKQKVAHRRKRMEIKEERSNETKISLEQGERDDVDGSSSNNDLTEAAMTAESGNAEKSPRMNRKNQRFPCEVCGALVRMQYINKHKQTHEERTLACDQCENVYSCKNKLRTHQLQVHTDELKYICDECGKGFKALPYLKQHRQTHIKEKTIQCPICPMKFKYKGVLRTHMKIHSDVKPYSCEQCGMKFYRKDQLNTHKKHHSDQRPFSCPQCQKQFKLKSDMKKHFRIHLPPKNFCEVCGKAFVQKYNMRIHMKTHGMFP